MSVNRYFLHRRPAGSARRCEKHLAVKPYTRPYRALALFGGEYGIAFREALCVKLPHVSAIGHYSLHLGVLIAFFVLVFVGLERYHDPSSGSSAIHGAPALENGVVGMSMS